MIGVLGISAIKFMYFYLTHKNELEMQSKDFLIIGSISGVFLANLSLGLNYIPYGLGLGLFYGLFYNLITNHFVVKRKRRAEQIGIKL